MALKELMVSVGGGNFRPADEDYFKWVHSVKSTTKQESPFIVLKRGDTHAVATLYNLLMTVNPSSSILQAWPGRFRTDVFHFHLCDLLDWRKKNAIST